MSQIHYSTIIRKFYLNKKFYVPKFFLYCLSDLELKGKLGTLNDLLREIDIPQKTAEDAINELKSDRLINLSNNIINNSTISLTELGVQLVNDLLNKTYAHKLRNKAIFYLLSKKDQEVPVFFDDFKKYLGGKTKRKQSKISNLLKELKKDYIVKINFVKSAENAITLKKAIYLTEFGCSIAGKLVCEGLTPNETLILSAYREIPIEKRSSFVVEFLAEYNKKLGKELN